MNIALFGYGKMGHEIESIATLRGHKIPVHFDSEEEWIKQGGDLPLCDVAIDFSTPQSAISNIHRCFSAKIPIVCGTTGWHNQLEAMQRECLSTGNALFFASNFSLGVNLFFELNRHLARMMNHHIEYSASIEEIHHIHKLDAPSGTAITLANDIIAEVDRLTSWNNSAEHAGNELPIRSIRQGEVTGTHTISYDSEADTIEIKHIARSRRGFAIGAVLAAEFIHGKSGFFGMNDLLGIG
jgi:4-hydroxy-tetrahydrodipicolinate reductase